MVTISDPAGIALVRLISLKCRLKLEIQGLKFRGRSAYAIIKEEFSLKGTRQRVFDQFCEIINTKEKERALDAGA